MSTRSFQTFFYSISGRGNAIERYFTIRLLSCLFLLPTHYNPPSLSSKPNNSFHAGISTFSSSSWRTNKAFSFTASARSRLVDENNHTSTGCVIIIASLFYTNISLTTLWYHHHHLLVVVFSFSPKLNTSRCFPPQWLGATPTPRNIQNSLRFIILISRFIRRTSNLYTSLRL